MNNGALLQVCSIAGCIATSGNLSGMTATAMEALRNESLWIPLTVVVAIKHQRRLLVCHGYVGQARPV